MPTYTYTCLECVHNFEIFLLISDYKSDQPPHCPICDSITNVKRDFEADLPAGRMVAQTLGSLADKNTASMSKDAREAQWYAENKYRFEGETAPLPDGMESLRKKGKFDIRGTNKFRKKRSPNKKK